MKRQLQLHKGWIQCQKRYFFIWQPSSPQWISVSPAEFVMMLSARWPPMEEDGIGFPVNSRLRSSSFCCNLVSVALQCYCHLVMNQNDLRGISLCCQDKSWGRARAVGEGWIMQRSTRWNNNAAWLPPCGSKIYRFSKRCKSSKFYSFFLPTEAWTWIFAFSVSFLLCERSYCIFHCFFFFCVKLYM